VTGLAALACLALITADPASVSAAAQATPQPSASPSPSPSPSATPGDKPSKVRSPEDGWFDVSGFLDEAYGFVPIAAPVTEPAIGYGAAGALMFIGKPSEGSTGLARPSITAIGGLGTENETWAGFGADVRHWGDNRVQTVIAGVKASVNLDFTGTGDEAIPEGRDIGYNLEPTGGMAQVKYRLGGSRAWVGLSYMLAQTVVSFDVPEGTPGLPTTPRETKIGGITPSLTYDTRDSLFTTGRGTYIEAGAGFHGSAFGGDVEYQKVTVVAMQFLPLHPKVHLGLRVDAGATYGDPPFYMRPFVSLRGAPIMRYQRDNLAQGEAEARWQFWKRFSLVGFAGHGVVWNDETEDNADTRKVTVTTGGGGIRYELARRYKLHMGADVAWGPDGAALYIQFGSAWSRP
jgi:hypothetical protein